MTTYSATAYPMTTRLVIFQSSLSGVSARVWSRSPWTWP